MGWMPTFNYDIMSSPIQENVCIDSIGPESTGSGDVNGDMSMCEGSGILNSMAALQALPS